MFKLGFKIAEFKILIFKNTAVLARFKMAELKNNNI